MKNVEILTTFRGYPDDTVTSETTYMVGAKVELQDAFADLIIGKGLAKEIAERPARAANVKSEPAP